MPQVLRRQERRLGISLFVQRSKLREIASKCLRLPARRKLQSMPSSEINASMVSIESSSAWCMVERDRALLAELGLSTEIAMCETLVQMPAIAPALLPTVTPPQAP